MRNPSTGHFDADFPEASAIVEAAKAAPATKAVPERDAPARMPSGPDLEALAAILAAAKPDKAPEPEATVETPAESGLIRTRLTRARSFVTAPAAATGAEAAIAEVSPVQATPAAEPAPIENLAASPLARAAATSRRFARAIATEPRGRFAASLAAVLGFGVLGGFVMAQQNKPAPAAVTLVKAPPMIIAAPDWSATTVFNRQEASDLRRLVAELRGMKGGVEAVREGIERSAKDSNSRFAQISDRLEKLKASDKDLAERIGQIAERLEREPKVAQVLDRLERIEKQASANPQVTHVLPPPKPTEPTMTGSVGEARDKAERGTETRAADKGDRAAETRTPDAKAAETKGAESKTAEAKLADAKFADAKPKPVALEGWSLLEVYDGLALVEAPNQRLHEIAPGRNLPGAGRVETIERRGRVWVVQTSKGLIVPAASGKML